jgi:Cytochrome c7 and related cytochrome c
MYCQLKLVLGVLLFLFAATIQAETENPHTVSTENKSAACTTCHKSNPELKANGLLNSKNMQVDQAGFGSDGIAMCSSCHDPENGHKVGLELDFETPGDLPVMEGNKMSCLTCHYTHGSLTSERPQASFSFMDRLFDAERLHKSFLLRRNNSDGELCLICHNVNKGSK